MDKISHYYVSESSQSDDSDMQFSNSSDEESSKIFKNKNNYNKNNLSQPVNEKSESSHT